MFAENSLFLKAGSGTRLDQQNIIELILDPKIRLGASAPKIETACDHTRYLLMAIDTKRLDAFKIQSEPAIQLMEIDVDTKQKTLPQAMIFEQKS